MNKPLLWLMACLLPAQLLLAQPYYARHYQVEDGLSNNAVICSLPDENGFLWFGTKDGLNRFDGYTFKVFRADPDAGGSIGSNFIHCLLQDKDGLIWVGTEDGIFTYDARLERFAEFDTAIRGTIRDMKLDRQGNLWYITGLTLFRYNRQTHQNQVYPTATFFEATSIDTSAGGAVWVSTTGGWLQQYNAVKDVFTGHDLFAHSAQPVSRWVEKIQCTDAAILAGTATQGAKLYHIASGTYKDILTYNNDGTGIFVRNFMRTSATEYWVATESGIYIYNVTTGKAGNLVKKYNDAFSLSDNAVYTFSADKEGGIWAGTYFGGINYYPRAFSPFKKYFPQQGQNSLSGNVVREITEDRFGNLWIGTEDAGLNKLNPTTGKFTNYGPTGQPGSIAYTNIHGLLARGNELWVGTFEHGLDVMNIATGAVTRRYQVGPAQPALLSNFFYCVYQSPAGKLLFGTSRGAYQLNEVNNQLQPVACLPQNQWYTALLQTADGAIWAATYGNGVSCYRPATGELKNYRYNAAAANSISSNRVNSLFKDSDGGLWMATEGGLCRFNPATADFTRFTTKNGLPGNFILSLLEDDKKTLWISTTNGLVSMPLKGGMMEIYTTDNGLLNDQFNFSSAYKDARGQMYFGSARGMIGFRPADMQRNTFVPPVFITGFQVNNQELVIGGRDATLQQSIAYTKELTLPYDQSTFSLDFAALSFNAPAMLEYAYKMEGLGADWTYIKQNRKVFFTELSPGTYVFKVKAATRNGVWSNKETRLVIIIRPPWWATWWAYALYAVLALAAVWLLVRNYHKRVQLKNQRNLERLQVAKEKEIFQAKIEFFTNVAHEIRTPLTLIKGPLEKVIQKAGFITELTNSLRTMERNTNRLVDLTNQLLDFRQTEIKGFSLNFVRVNISELLEETFQNFKPLAEEKNLAYTLSLPRKNVVAYVDIEALHKILSNLFSNAIKYAAGKVIIRLLAAAPTDAFFVVEIANDGFVIPADMREQVFLPFFRLKETEKQKGTGIGLALSRSLADLHKGTIVLAEPADGMNVFCLRLPVHQATEFNLHNHRSAAEAAINKTT